VKKEMPSKKGKRKVTGHRPKTFYHGKAFGYTVTRTKGKHGVFKKGKYRKFSGKIIKGNK
jgi:hypothetical protein